VYSYSLRPAGGLYALQAGELVPASQVRIVEVNLQDRWLAEYEWQDHGWHQRELITRLAPRRRPLKTTAVTGGLEKLQAVDLPAPRSGHVQYVPDGRWTAILMNGVVLALVKGPLEGPTEARQGDVLATVRPQDVQLAVLKGGKNVFLRPKPGSFALSWDGKLRVHDALWVHLQEARAATTADEIAEYPFRIEMLARRGRELTEEGWQRLAERVSFGEEPLVVRLPEAWGNSRCTRHELTSDAWHLEFATELGSRHLVLPALVDPYAEVLNGEDLPAGAPVADPIHRRPWTAEELQKELDEEERLWLVDLFVRQWVPLSWIQDPAEVAIKVPEGKPLKTGGLLYAPMDKPYAPLCCGRRISEPLAVG